MIFTVRDDKNNLVQNQGQYLASILIATNYILLPSAYLPILALLRQYHPTIFMLGKLQLFTLINHSPQKGFLCSLADNLHMRRKWGGGSVERDCYFALSSLAYADFGLCQPLSLIVKCIG